MTTSPGECVRVVPQVQEHEHVVVVRKRFVVPGVGQLPPDAELAPLVPLVEVVPPQDDPRARYPPAVRRGQYDVPRYQRSAAVVPPLGGLQRDRVGVAALDGLRSADDARGGGAGIGRRGGGGRRRRGDGIGAKRRGGLPRTGALRPVLAPRGKDDDQWRDDRDRREHRPDGERDRSTSALLLPAIVAAAVAVVGGGGVGGGDCDVRRVVVVVVVAVVVDDGKVEVARCCDLFVRRLIDLHIFGLCCGTDRGEEMD